MKKQFLILILILTVNTWSCEDFLDREPNLEVSVNEQFSSFEGARNAMIGAYSDLREILRGKFFLYGDLMGGNIKFAPDDNGNLEVNANTTVEETYNLNYTVIDNDFSATYTNFYKIINNLNQILRTISAVPDATESQINFLLAEAFAMRAWTHFELVKMYAQHHSFTTDGSHRGIVYNKEVLGIGDFPGRLNSTETYHQIIEDFNDAIDLYAVTTYNYSPDLEKSYMSVDFINAMLTRVYLYKADYAMVISHSNSLIDTGNYILLTTNNYVEQWELSAPHSEIILELTPDFSGEDPSIDNLASFYNPEGSDNARFSASSDLLSLYTTTDVRRQNTMFNTVNFITNNAIDSSEDLPYYFTKKFQDRSPTSREGVPVIRLSEVILNKAEAQLKLGNLSEAIASLNQIRLNRDLNAPPLDSLSEEALALEIFNERRKELCFENHLFYDLARLKKDISRDEGCISLQCNLNYPNYRYAQPIPRGSVNVNSNLEQNEGY
jgi:hypothetical protein